MLSWLRGCAQELKGRKVLNIAESIHPRKDFTFQELQTGTTPSAHMADFILRVPFGTASGSVSTTYDGDAAPRSGFHHLIHEGFGSPGKSFPFKYPHRTIPHNLLSPSDSLSILLAAFRTTVQALRGRGERRWAIKKSYLNTTSTKNRTQGCTSKFLLEPNSTLQSLKL